MKKLIYRISMLVGVLTLISCLLSGISLYTSIIRSVIVFLSMLFIIIMALKILRWGLLITEPKPKQHEEALEKPEGAAETSG